jgi:hypothetical protein
MSSKLTVPPAIRSTFAKYAFQICLRAEVDDLEFEGKHREICNDLEQEWERTVESKWGVEPNPDEAARDTALREYGSIEEASRSMKRPFAERFIFHNRYRTERLLLVLVCFFLQLDIVEGWRMTSLTIVVSGTPKYGFNMLVVLPLVFIYCWKRREIPAGVMHKAATTARKVEDMSLLAKIRSIVRGPNEEIGGATKGIWGKRFTGLIFLLSVFLLSLPSTVRTATYYLCLSPVGGATVLVVHFYLWLQGVLLGIAAACLVHDAGMIRADLFRRWLLKLAR